MSLQTRLIALAQAIGADVKQLREDVAKMGGGSGSSLESITMNTSFGSVTWNNMPAALTELNGASRSRVKTDLTARTQARVICAMSAAGSTDAELRIQYSTNGDTQTAWAYLDGADGPKVNIAAAIGRASPWVTIATAARTDVWLRVVGINGNGNVDPVIGNVVLQVK